MFGQIEAMNAEIRRPTVVLVCQQYEERRGIDAAVVPPERHLAERRHLATPGFVQDLARLGVLLDTDDLGLGRSEISKDAAGERRIDPEHLERGDDAVAPEGRAEPGDAGVGIRPVRRVGRHQRTSAERSVDPAVELLVRGRDARVFAHCIRRDRCSTSANAASKAGAAGPTVAAHVTVISATAALVRVERDGEGGGCFRQGGRNRIEGQAGAADEVIEALVGELHRRTVDARRQAAASLGRRVPRTSKMSTKSAAMSMRTSRVTRC